MKKLFKMTIRKRNTLTGYMFLLPWLFGLLTLSLYPIIYSIRISFSDVRLMPGEVIMNWYGFDRYLYLFTVHPDFREFLLNDIRFIAVSLLIVLPFSLIVAILLNAKFRFRAIFRVVFFLPVIIMSGPAIMSLMGDLNEVGLMNNPILFPVFMILPGMVADAAAFVLNNLVTFMWFSGVQILIFLAGLQKIDSSSYEAAEIDGASKWECFWKITLPYMKTLILINAIYTVVEVANFGGTISPLQGSAINDVDVTNHIAQVNFFILQNLMNVVRPFSLSAAASWVYFLSIALVLVVVLLVYKFFEGRDKA